MSAHDPPQCPVFVVIHELIALVFLMYALLTVFSTATRNIVGSEITLFKIQLNSLMIKVDVSRPLCVLVKIHY